ncbi:hypothetical protein A3D05_01820 [Candidatus Gottesmanbacteria bacterium RIFCSPHIGHO2_02_FULL_40_24]|nr:MAG: hypothetical protein A3D05_01820 [Candidatus Gottesmanbacteria bacterium RIFCSPHIGHO2_02_FULL_40_24]OGG22854.1 MAG: hypothetical protein A3B48_05725 [Candidatus Gottesmanbacteria bacterium RIFCSPLOWO2_01_FULL_40_10]OGG24910.1 MAG: hypothetical protein A3E42_02640 [Candidatus Gottesmanbacteria bacterium RIFCSPHIGHO2_12_FULL_40_13]OGG31747.1 MAG: hypothetical protein A3I80_00760 [Candidatus Gottesmanbacteria bacterium RIFCSPLOWO2_02_FULL_40_10]
MPVRKTTEKVRNSTIEKSPSKNVINYLLIGLIVISAFIIGSLYQKVKLLEGGTVKPVNQAAEVNNQPIIPPAASKQDIKINNDDPVLGSSKAKVTVVEFSDFLCPYCAAFSGVNSNMVLQMKERFADWEPALPGLKKDYIDKGLIRFVFKDYPLHGEEAILVHQGAKCAQDQDKFWEFHDVIFEKYGEENLTYSKDTLKDMAGKLSLNQNDFDNCLDGDKYAQKMRDAISYAQSVGAQGTPATYINGKLVSGADTYSAFKTLIEEELKK